MHWCTDVCFACAATAISTILCAYNNESQFQTLACPIPSLHIERERDIHTHKIIDTAVHDWPFAKHATNHQVNESHVKFEDFTAFDERKSACVEAKVLDEDEDVMHNGCYDVTSFL